MMLCSGKTSLNTAICCRAKRILTHTTAMCSRRRHGSFTTTRMSHNNNSRASISNPCQQQRLPTKRTMMTTTMKKGKLLQSQNTSAFQWQGGGAYRPLVPTATLSVTSGGALWDTLLTNAIAAALLSTRQRTTTSCEAAAAGAHQHAMVSYHPTVPAKIQKSSSSSSSSWLGRACRMILRFIKLTCTLGPVVALYPIFLWTNNNQNNTISGEQQDAHEILLAGYDESGPPPGRLLSWYLNMCLTCVEYSGAAVIKLMQWAGSRPDMFGHDFCRVFSRLQDDTTPHAWKHTERSMRKAYGPNWQSRIQLHEIIGSGCIGQVYRGQVLLASSSSPSPSASTNVSNKHAATTTMVAASSLGCQQQPQQAEVAVKVLHPNVEQDIDADLDLMRFAVRAIQWFPFAQGLKWLDLEGIVEEFAVLLKEQLDLRNEAVNLQRFHQNFDRRSRKSSSSSSSSNSSEVNVIFPHLVQGFAPSRNVLVETFCDGIPVLEFARQHKEDQEMLSHMCRTAISAVCKMIFLDNFMHGMYVLLSLQNKCTTLNLCFLIFAFKKKKNTHSSFSQQCYMLIRRLASWQCLCFTRWQKLYSI
jgi:ABC1 atypical kinase-like domain